MRGSKLLVFVIIISLSLSMTFMVFPVRSTTTYEWTRDSEFNYGSTYWYPKIGEWNWDPVSGAIYGTWIDKNPTSTDFVKFTTEGSDHIVHLSIDNNDWGYVAVAKAVQGWVWGNKPSGVYQPTPLHVTSNIVDIRINTRIIWSTVSPTVGGVLINVWLKIEGNGVDIYQNEQWEHYDQAILGIDLYYLHTGQPLSDREFREAGSSNGIPVFVYTRYRENQASGTFDVPLLQILNDAVSDASRIGVYFNLHDLVLYEVDAVVEEYSGYAAAKFSRLKVYYEVTGSGACPTLSVWSNSTWVTEGVMDIHVGSYNIDTVYRHYLATRPGLIRGNFYVLKLSELDEYTSYIDKVQLVAVSDNGSAIYLPLVIAFDNHNRSITRLVRNSDDVWLVLRPDDEVYLWFYYSGTLDNSWRFVFIIEGHNPKSGY